MNGDCRWQLSILSTNVDNIDSSPPPPNHTNHGRRPLGEHYPIPLYIDVAFVCTIYVVSSVLIYLFVSWRKRHAGVVRTVCVSMNLGYMESLEENPLILTVSVDEDTVCCG